MIIPTITNTIKRTIPERLWRPYVVSLLNVYYSLLVLYRPYFSFVRWRYKSVVKKLQKKEKLKVAFFVIYDSIWKYDGIYRLLEQDNRFELFVVVCPHIEFGEETMLSEISQTYNFFDKKGFNVINTFNYKNRTWLNVKKEIAPDIIFFCDSWLSTKPEYYITNYLDCLTCYAPYNFGNSHLYQEMHNQIFHNLLWRLFAETKTHKDFSIKYAVNKGVNVTVTGYPGTDIFLDRTYIPKDVWKIKDRNIKRIIWAPHHSIEGEGINIDYSSFLKYSEFMIELCQKYQNRIQVAFKPHPNLKPKLNKEKNWGQNKTKEYFDTWGKISNGQLIDSDYADLFLTSDAMMHDSGSFLIEYLYTGKPVLHLNRDEHLTDGMNSFGILAFNQHYHAKNKEDIIEFIENVISGKDEKKQERQDFLVSNLLPPNNKSASENIYDELIKNCFTAHKNYN